MEPIGPDREKAMRAVRAMFDRYKKLAALRQDNHIVLVSKLVKRYVLMLSRILTVKSCKVLSLLMPVSMAQFLTR